MSKRTLMLASVVRDAIAPILRECPRECGIVSITRIDVSPDASYATIYISALQHPDAALSFLEGRRTELQRSLSKLQRRTIPLLRFRIDHGQAAATRIDRLLGEASKEPPEDSPKSPQ